MQIAVPWTLRRALLSGLDGIWHLSARQAAAGEAVQCFL